VGVGYKQNITVRDTKFPKFVIFLDSPAAQIFYKHAGAHEKKEQVLSHPLSLPLSGGVIYSVGKVLDSGFQIVNHQNKVTIHNSVAFQVFLNDVSRFDERQDFLCALCETNRGVCFHFVPLS
jgi:hypothetical protein